MKPVVANLLQYLILLIHYIKIAEILVNCLVIQKVFNCSIISSLKNLLLDVLDGGLDLSKFMVATNVLQHPILGWKRLVTNTALKIKNIMTMHKDHKMPTIPVYSESFQGSPSAAPPSNASQPCAPA